MVALQPNTTTPWENLGSTFDSDNNYMSSEIIEQSELDWTVEKIPLLANDVRNGRILPVEDSYAVIRRSHHDHQAGTILGRVGSRYEPVQNSNAFAIMDKIIQQGNARFIAAGDFKNGAIVWAQVALGDPLVINGDDCVARNLTLLNSHDGSVSLSMLITPLRLWCMNMLAALRKNSSMSLIFRHTISATAQFEAASHEILMANASFEDAAEGYRVLANASINSHLLGGFFKSIFPDGETDLSTKLAVKRREEVLNVYETGRGTQTTPHTFWRAMNAIVEWVDYYRGRTDDSRVRSSLLGKGRQIKEHAFDTALRMVTHG